MIDVQYSAVIRSSSLQSDLVLLDSYRGEVSIEHRILSGDEVIGVASQDQNYRRRHWLPESMQNFNLDFSKIEQSNIHQEIDRTQNCDLGTTILRDACELTTINPRIQGDDDVFNFKDQISQFADPESTIEIEMRLSTGCNNVIFTENQNVVYSHDQSKATKSNQSECNGQLECVGSARSYAEIHAASSTKSSCSGDSQSQCPICLHSLDTDHALLCSATRRSASSVVQALQDAASIIPLSNLTSNSSPVAMTPCGHLFHAACIVQAMQHSFCHQEPPRCPLCRAALTWSWWCRKSSKERTAGAGWPMLVRAARRNARPHSRRNACARCCGCVCLCFIMSAIAMVFVAVGLLARYL